MTPSDEVRITEPGYIFDIKEADRLAEAPDRGREERGRYLRRRVGQLCGDSDHCKNSADDVAGDVIGPEPTFARAAADGRLEPKITDAATCTKV